MIERAGAAQNSLMINRLYPPMPYGDAELLKDALNHILEHAMRAYGSNGEFHRMRIIAVATEALDLFEKVNDAQNPAT